MAATILVDSTETGDAADHIASLLIFLGISFDIQTLPEFLSEVGKERDACAQVVLLCSSKMLGRMIEACDRYGEVSQRLISHVHSAFVYRSKGHQSFHALVSSLGNEQHQALITLDHDRATWNISDKAGEYCGVMAGLTVQSMQTSGEMGNAEALLDERGTVFGRYAYKSIPLFISACESIIDLGQAITTGNFDVREHFMPAVPLVMHAIWAFADSCWHAPEIGACLVIDDPLLRSRYGCLSYQALLEAMERHKFSTNIAFIPWNWRRSNSKVVELFKSNRDKLSLSIHGCDHTGGEFGTENLNLLTWKAKQSIERMARHEFTTGISHDRVMVFPQGVFSSAAMSVLKQSSFTASVNTEVIGIDRTSERVTISDVWDVAVMKHGCFPLFTRRYPHQGVENFAFDILLGKPCIVVVHHDAFRKKAADLLDFIDRLNALTCKLRWTGLGEVIRSSCRQRNVTDGITETQMYGSQLQLTNCSKQAKRFVVTRRESDSSIIKEIRVGHQYIPWAIVNGRIVFEIEIAAGQNTTVEIHFHNRPNDKQYCDPIGYRIKTAMRRYLSEVRDDYVAVRGEGFRSVLHKAHLAP